jgi:hypothetical protein
MFVNSTLGIRTSFLYNLYCMFIINLILLVNVCLWFIDMFNDKLSLVC